VFLEAHGTHGCIERPLCCRRSQACLMKTRFQTYRTPRITPSSFQAAGQDRRAVRSAGRRLNLRSRWICDATLIVTGHASCANHARAMLRGWAVLVACFGKQHACEQ